MEINKRTCRKCGEEIQCSYYVGFGICRDCVIKGASYKEVIFQKIIIDNETNQILRYGIEEEPELGEYIIERPVDLTVWQGYEIYYNKLRGTFEKGNII